MDSEKRRVRKLTKRLDLVKGALAIAVLPTLATYGYAQAFTFNETNTESSLPKGAIAGTPTIDVVRLSQGSPSVPLRHGNIVNDSEILYAGATKLRRGSDYQIDYATGLIYLMRSFKAGDTMSVSYRYNSAVADPTGALTSLTSMKFDLVPSALKFSLGLGMTERQSDGNVLMTNVYGWNNAFGFGQSKVSGLFFIGQRQKVDTANGYDKQASPGATDVGTSQFILQKLTSNVSGGTIEASYQDISKNFTNFQSVKDSGYEVGYIDQITKEKGLTRMGLAMNDVKVGDTKVSQSYKEVNDGSGTISWQQYALAQGPFSLAWKEQKVGKSFKRFGDIYEQDKGQLQKEAGINRDWVSAGFKQKSFAISYDQNTIEDQTGVGIFRENIKFETGSLKFASAEQRISTDFTRFASLSEADQVQWAKERGMTRKTMSLDYGINGAKGAPLHYAENRVETPGGDFASSEFSAGGKGWTFNQKSVGAEKGFGNLSTLTAAEQDGFVKTIAAMYPLATVQIKPEEKNWFIQGSGLERTFQQFNWQPSKTMNIEANRLDMAGINDSSDLNQIKGHDTQVHGNLPSRVGWIELHRTQQDDDVRARLSG